MKPLDERGAAVRDLLIQVIENQPEVTAKRRKKLGLLWGGVGVLTIGVASIAAAAVVANRQVVQYDVVHCLSSLERGSDGTYDESSVVMDPEIVGNATPEDAIDVCVLMWEQGVLSPGHDPIAATPSPGQVPANLTICVMEDGSAAVVPGKPESCAALGLAGLAD